MGLGVCARAVMHGWCRCYCASNGHVSMSAGAGPSPVSLPVLTLLVAIYEAVDSW